MAATSENPPVYAFEIGQRLTCTWRNGELHTCEIIERRINHEGTSQYYVHYIDYNRRLDEWVDPDRLGQLEKVNDRKRKLDPAVAAHVSTPHSHADEATAGELDAATQRAHEAATKVKNINRIVLGRWEIQTWYYSPFPYEFSMCDTLFFCEYDLHFCQRKVPPLAPDSVHRDTTVLHSPRQDSLRRYMKRCEATHPPGDEIYRNGDLSVFEVDGATSRTYCQSLCLLAKLFLDHKTLYYDVEPFLFYVITECDAFGCHPVGYFSKEKHSADDFNLACILTLPPYQRKGYGRFLISFSYELSRLEGKVGTPERPLSDLGMVSYRSYWSYELLNILQNHRGAISINQLSEKSAIKTEDIVSTMQSLNLIKYWKGAHTISVSPRVIQEHLLGESNKRAVEVDRTKIVWTPHHLRSAIQSGIER